LCYWTLAMETSRLIKGRYPAQSTSPIADAIRLRRGERGITPLDAALLHVPSIAEGWNSFLGAVRTQGKLPGDVRELMVDPFSSSTTIYVISLFRFYVWQLSMVQHSNGSTMSM
jgi:hypothetical protein